MSGTILGIGPLELILIAVLVLLVFGPERLPTLMRQAGRAVRRLREFYVRFATDLRTELTPFEEEIKVLRDVTNELRRDLAEIRDAADLRTAIQPITIDTSVPASAGKTASNDSPAGAATSSPAGKPAANGAKAADATQATAMNSPEPPAPAAGSTQPADMKTPAAPLAARNDNAPPLAEGNPWAQLGQAARADALDDDNPWAAA